jgi:predicted DNA-binding protein
VPIVYVETNVLVAVATGRDPAAGIMLEKPPAGLRIVIPSFCFFEALDWLESENKRNNRYTDELNQRINQLDRDLTSPHARQLRTHLEDALVEAELLARDVVKRLDRAIQQLTSHAELIDLTASAILRSRLEPIIEQVTDNLILHSILAHAPTSTETTRAFLTENHREFGTQEVKAALEAAGIEGFRDTNKFLGWAAARSSPPGP